MTKIELVRILKKYEYDDKVINYILSKNIKPILKRNPEELEKLISLIKEADIKIEKCLTILARPKAEKIKKIIEILKVENIDVRNCLSVLAHGKADEIKKILILLKNENIDVKACLSVLAYGKADEIKKIIEILKTENIDVKACLSILAYGKADEIKKIIEILKVENIDVRNCLSVLASSKADEIKKIIEILKVENIGVRNCLTILSKGKADEIKKIIQILKAENIDVRDCLSILAFGKTDEIKKITEILKAENIEIENLKQLNIGALFLKKYEYICDLILLKKRTYTNNDIKLYFKLKYTYNKLYNKQEIEEICNKLNIDLHMFLSVFLSSNEYIQNKMIEHLNLGGNLWIGNSLPCTKQQLIDNKELIMKLCKYVPASFIKEHKQYCYMMDDMQGYVLDIIMNKCGAFFYEYNEEKILFYLITAYCKKALNKYICDPSTIQIIENILPKSRIENEEYANQCQVLDDIEFDYIEREIINYMSYLLEHGVTNYEDILKDKYTLDDEQYDSLINNIKLKILSRKDSTQM